MSTASASPSPGGPDQVAREQVAVEGAPADEPDVIVVARMKSENARLRGELRQALARADRAERSVVRMEKSAKYTIGTLLVDAARHPSRIFLLPRDLLRIYRLRKHRRTLPPETRTAPQRARREDVLDLDAARLLLPRAVATRTPSPANPRLSIAGALGDDLIAAWSPYASVTPLLPHDAAALVSGVDPDIVVIDTAAAGPLGPWAHLGDPGAADREAAAVRLVDAAHERGRPVVLIRRSDPSRTASLGALAERCDLVLDGPGSWRGSPWQPGIDLGQGRVGSHGWPAPVGTGLALLGGLVLPGGFDPTDGDRATSDPGISDRGISDPGIDVHRPDPAHPSVRAIARAIAASAAVHIDGVGADRVGAHSAGLVALASGRRVVVGTPGGATHDSDLADFVGDPAAVLDLRGSTVHEAVEAALVPLTAAERWALLRRLATTVAAPVRLADLVERLGLMARPLAVRDVALRLPAGDWQPATLDAVMEQSHPPREVVVAADTHVPDVARAALAEVGIAVVDVDPSLACRSRWLADADPRAGRDVLLDLVIAAEVTGFPAVALDATTPGAMRLTPTAAPHTHPQPVEHPGWSA